VGVRTARGCSGNRVDDHRSRREVSDQSQPIIYSYKKIVPRYSEHLLSNSVIAHHLVPQWFGCRQVQLNARQFVGHVSTNGQTLYHLCSTFLAYYSLLSLREAPKTDYSGNKDFSLGGESAKKFAAAAGLFSTSNYYISYRYEHCLKI